MNTELNQKEYAEDFKKNWEKEMTELNAKIWAVRCPFHEERTPSLMINKERNSWHCFGCNEGGTLEEFKAKLKTLKEKKDGKKNKDLMRNTIHEILATIDLEYDIITEGCAFCRAYIKNPEERNPKVKIDCGECPLRDEKVKSCCKEFNEFENAIQVLRDKGYVVMGLMQEKILGVKKDENKF